MAKRGGKTTRDKDQMILDLFQDIAEKLSLNGGSQEQLSDFEFRFRQVLKSTLETAAKRDVRPMDRIEVAAQMSRVLGREITKTNIDNWTAMSTLQRRIHVDAMKALCEVTGDWTALKLLVESCGFRLLTPDEAVCAEYGAKMMLKKMIDSDIKDTLSGVDEATMRRLLIQRMTGGKE